MMTRASTPHAHSTVRVHYGGAAIPAIADVCSGGGHAKLQRLQRGFPDTLLDFDVLYLVSSNLPKRWPSTFWAARDRGKRIVWSQAGVSYPAVGPEAWEDVNLRLEQGVHAADYVLYQSEFCRRTCDRFLGARAGASDVLYNAVDTTTFSPLPNAARGRLITVLAAGTQHLFSTFQTAVSAFACLSRRVDAQMLVTGGLRWDPDRGNAEAAARGLVERLGLGNRVRFLGEYTQADAPDIYRRADVLLHARYDDWCPNVVIEALACGLPVVFSRSGGTPELVGEDAGCGVAVESRWDREGVAKPEVWAEAIQHVLANHRRYAEAARQRALDRFDLCHWIDRHASVFEAVVASPAYSSPERVGVSEPLREPLRIISIAPERAVAGRPFNLQPDGSSAIAITAEGATGTTFVLFDGIPLETSFAGEALVSAIVPRQLTDSPGRHTIRLGELLRTSDEHEFLVEPERAETSIDSL